MVALMENGGAKCGGLHGGTRYGDEMVGLCD